MKNLVKAIIAATSLAVISLGVTPVMAQSSGNAIVTVTITDVLALAVAVPAVPLAAGSVADFQGSPTFTAPAQLVISSNRPYDVKVKSDGDLMGQLTASGSSIPIASLLVQAAPTTTSTFTSQLSLSNADQPLLTNVSAGMAKAYDVKYTIAGSALYVKGGAYKATLTYSVVAQ